MPSAKIAITSNPRTMTAPMAPSGFCRAKRPSAAT